MPEEKMEKVKFIANAVFDRKIRTPNDEPLMVSEGEAANLRRIGVVAEAGVESVTMTDSDNDEKTYDIVDNHETDGVNSEPISEPITGDPLPSPAMEEPKETEPEAAPEAKRPGRKNKSTRKDKGRE